MCLLWLNLFFYKITFNRLGYIIWIVTFSPYVDFRHWKPHVRVHMRESFWNSHWNRHPLLGFRGGTSSQTVPWRFSAFNLKGISYFVKDLCLCLSQYDIVLYSVWMDFLFWMVYFFILVWFWMFVWYRWYNLSKSGVFFFQYFFCEYLYRCFFWYNRSFKLL